VKHYDKSHAVIRWHLLEKAQQRFNTAGGGPNPTTKNGKRLGVTPGEGGGKSSMVRLLSGIKINH
jgi:ABC-type polysaccharide/polyol phosphate transport system ATPase subunit